MSIGFNLNKATTNLFTLSIPRVKAVDFEEEGMQELLLNVTGTIIPGVSLTPIERGFMGGKTKTINGEVEFEAWNVNFLVDEEFKNWNFLYNWMMKINNNNDQFVGEDFYIDATLLIYDNYKRPIFSVKIKDLWPTALSDVVLTYREGETYLECTCGFTYDRFEVTRNI